MRIIITSKDRKDKGKVGAFNEMLHQLYTTYLNLCEKEKGDMVVTIRGKK